MDKENITRDRKKAPGKKASVQLNIRVTPELSKWLKEKDYSPTGIFKEAINDLGFKPKEL